MARGEPSGRTVGKAGGGGRLALIITLSALAHLIVLAVLGMSSPEIRARLRIDEEPITVSLLKPDLRPRPAREWTTDNPSDAPRSRVDPLQPRQVSPLAPPAEMSPLALTPGPHPGSGGINGRAGQAMGPNRLGEVQKILRASPIACANRDTVGLTRLEREACNEVLGRNARKVIAVAAPIDPAKRVRLDQISAKQDRDRDWRQNPTMPVGTDAGPDGWPAGLGAPSETTFPVRK